MNNELETKKIVERTEEGIGFFTKAIIYIVGMSAFNILLWKLLF